MRRAATAKAKPEPGIQDNSFLVEEAYNQEYGVVQHIQNVEWLAVSHQWIYTFTQEWPFDPAPRNQLSYTIPLLHDGGFAGSGLGIGDVALNYRYQLIGTAKSNSDFAPRISLLLPTGNYHVGRGSGGLGIQTMLPFSLVINEKLVAHFNAGATFIPVTRSEFGARAATYGYNFGQSFVWRYRPRVNFMLETVYFSSQDVIASDQTRRSNQVFLNPGVRWAHSGL